MALSDLHFSLLVVIQDRTSSNGKSWITISVSPALPCLDARIITVHCIFVTRFRTLLQRSHCAPTDVRYVSNKCTTWSPSRASLVEGAPQWVHQFRKILQWSTHSCLTNWSSYCPRPQIVSEGLKGAAGTFKQQSKRKAGQSQTRASARASRKKNDMSAKKCKCKWI